MGLESGNGQEQKSAGNQFQGVLAAQEPDRSWNVTLEFNITVTGRSDHVDKSRDFYERMLRMVSHDPELVVRRTGSVPLDI